MDELLQNNIQQLSPEQQLEVAHFIYSSLAHNGQLLTGDQLEETRNRATQIELEPESTLSASEMWDKVDELKNARKN